MSIGIEFLEQIRASPFWFKYGYFLWIDSIWNLNQYFQKGSNIEIDLTLKIEFNFQVPNNLLKFKPLKFLDFSSCITNDDGEIFCAKTMLIIETFWKKYTINIRNLALR